MKTYIVSGIEPSKKGAGKFLKFFLEQLEGVHKNVNVVFMKTPENRFVKILKKTFLFSTLKHLYYLVYRNIINKNIIEDTEVFIFHPQSLGISLTNNLIIKNKRIYIYVLDNFFFCLKSYNQRSENYHSCFECLDDIKKSQLYNCKSSPNRISFKEYVSFIETVNNNLHKITFLSQNNNQTKLLTRKFGKQAKIKQIGMYTGEIVTNNKEKNNLTFWNYKYDILYHNTLIEAKGIFYFLELSLLMKNRTFIIPYSKNEVENYCKTKIYNQNISFISCTWETGLKELIAKSRICVTPSIWSAPIEGALLKSLFYGSSVAVIPAKYSFASEIPDDICIKLPQKPNDAAIILENFLKKNNSLNLSAKKWVSGFIEENVNKIKKFLIAFDN